LYTDGNEYAAGHLLHINKDHARQAQKSFRFNYKVWMNTFCHTDFLPVASHMCSGTDNAVRFTE